MEKLNKNITWEIRKLRKNGKSFKNIAKVLNVSSSTARKYSYNVKLTKEAKYKIKKESIKMFKNLLKNLQKVKI